ncbi:MAG: cyclic nucleotide-binding domain-containing protein [Candidatus Rokubacteria bacterium]|nr:cyclic nucleotide-binding domain-containing protein [Candidatus Rokubacteria bacterium]
MTSSELVKTFRTVLCPTLTGDQAMELISATVPVSLPAGDLVFREGEKSNGLFILLRGSADVSKQAGDGTAKVLVTLKGPTVVGEMGLITDHPRSATVRAVSDCELHLLTKTQFARMLEAERLAAYKLIAAIADVLARRVEIMDQKILALGASEATGSAPVGELAALRAKLFTEWSF